MAVACNKEGPFKVDRCCDVVPPPARKAPDPLPKDSMDEFVDVMNQVQERQTWMAEMKKLGALDAKAERAMKAEIEMRLSEAKRLDKGIRAPCDGAQK